MNNVDAPARRPAKSAWKRPWTLLAKTPNEAAVAVLIAALDSDDPAIRDGASWRCSIGAARSASRDSQAARTERRALAADHRAPPGLSDQCPARRGVGDRPGVVPQACQAIVWFREYDLVPALFVAAEDEVHPGVDDAARTIVELAELLCADDFGPPIAAIAAIRN